MIKFITHFHERITTLFQDGNTLWPQLFRRWFPGIVMVVFFAVAQMMILNGSQQNRIYQSHQETIAAFLSDKNETMLQQTAGRSYETQTGDTVYEWRIHGDKETYRFFFGTETHAIYNETQEKWDTDPFPIPPLLARAFIYWDVGLIERYDGNGQLMIGGKMISVDDYTDDTVRYEGNVYAPLPALPERTESFIEEYTEEPLGSLKLLRQTRTERSEQLYVRGEQTAYRIDIDFDGSATIGTLNLE